MDGNSALGQTQEMMVSGKSDKDTNVLFYRIMFECAANWKSGAVLKLPIYRK
jgi:hypothetical protein